MDQIPYELVRNRIISIAEPILKTKNFTVHVEGGTEKGDNYIGVIYRVKITSKCAKTADKCENNDNCCNLNLVVKVPPENKIRREKFFARPSFLREAMAYDDVIPAFIKFQESKGIQFEDGFHEFPQCLGTLTDEGQETIIMRDLLNEGYKMYNRHNYITRDHVNMVMKILGKFHAISYAMKDQCSEEFDKYRKMEDIFKGRDNNDEMEKYFNIITERALSTLDPNKEQHMIDKIKKMFEKKHLLDCCIETTNGPAAEPYAVVCHGDCWNNNILYKYQDDKLVAARLLDWQIMRFSSPVCDLMYFIFLATSKTIRKKYYPEFLDIYYTSLTSYLKRLGSDPEELIPRHAFDDQLKKFGKFGFLMSIMLLPIITTRAEDIPDLDEMSEKLENGEMEEKSMKDVFNSENSKDAYQERIKGVITDMFELGYM